MEQGSSKKNNIIVLCVVIAVIAVALVAYFVISGQKDNGQPVSYTHLRAHETKANLACGQCNNGTEHRQHLRCLVQESR